MNQAVLISIKPKWVGLIASGKKKLEIRKTRPKIDTPFKVYIYQTKTHVPARMAFGGVATDVSGVVGEFICDICTEFTQDYYELSLVSDGSCVPIDEIKAYLGAANKNGYVWHISELKMYDKPKRLSDFQLACNHKEDCCTCKRWNTKTFDCIAGMTRPPQSWCYVEELP